VRWEKQGVIFQSDSSLPWATTGRAMMPTPDVLDNGRIRLYLGGTDESMVGRVGYIEVDARSPAKVLRVSPNTVLDIGAPGAFDDNGVVPSCVIRWGNEVWMYYVGFQLGTHVRYFMFSGIAVSRNGGESFHRYKTVPVFDRSDGESLFRTAPWVIQDNTQWRAWYVGGDKFVNDGDKELPSYVLRQTQSNDGLDWVGESTPLFQHDENKELGFGRPYVIREEDRLRMWYSIRKRRHGYRLGYAESHNGTSWMRRDAEVGIDVSGDGWDSEMVCYAAIVPTLYGTYMFYNGNGFGQTGVGYAVLIEDDT